MKSIIQSFMALHVFLYRLTDGWIGGKLGPNQILLLHTVGRKSGKAYIAPLVYFADGENLVIMASNNGADRHPGWYHNVRAAPQVTVTVQDMTLTVTAEVAQDPERSRLWAILISKHDQFRRYQEKTQRQIPLIILRPAA